MYLLSLATFAPVKKLLSSIVVLMFSFQIMYPAIFTAWFYANRAAIAGKYCENKARPQLHCNGKCFLTKKLQAIEAKKSSSSENAPIRNLWVETQPCIVAENIQPVEIDIQIIQEHLFAPTSHYEFTLYRRLMRPPAVVLS